MAQRYVNRLIHFSWRAQQPLNTLLPILDCHCYQITLHVSFQAYRLTCRPEVLHAGKPGILTRWFRRWENKQVTIVIPAMGSGHQSKYIISINDERVMPMPTEKSGGSTQQS